MIGSDPIEPRAQLGASVERTEVSIHADECILERFLRFLLIATNLVGKPVDRLLVSLDQSRKRGLVALFRFAYELIV